MRNNIKLVISFLIATFCIMNLNCTRENESICTEDIAEQIMNMEWEALDRWGNGDIDGYLDIYADEITYFSPGTEKRLDGIDTLKTLFRPMTGTVQVDHYEFINPKVQMIGNVALLTFNEIAFLPVKGGDLRESHWSCTEVYVKLNDEWKIIHSHWSRPPTHPTTDREEDI